MNHSLASHPASVTALGLASLLLALPGCTGSGAGSSGDGDDADGADGPFTVGAGLPNGAGGEASAAGQGGSGVVGTPSSGANGAEDGSSGGGGDPAGGGGGSGTCAVDCFDTGCAAGLTCVADAAGCGACTCSVPAPLPPMDPMRSLYVTEPEALDRFGLQRVLDHLLASADATGQTSLELYRQWWDLNADDATGVTSGPHCTGTLNGYPLECPRDEATLATSDPFSPTPLYTTVGIVNRFDKVPLDGSHCGQYRVSFNLMREVPGADPDFNYFILEAVMPNPRPDLGASGCLPIAKYWYDLSVGGPGPADRAARADALEALYFDGIPGFPPVLSWEHFRSSSNGSGQIRANQFLHSVSGQMWQLREYHLERTCAAEGDCRLEVHMDSVKDNPFGLLFRAPGSPEAPAQAAAFQAWFLDQVGSLASVTDVNDLALAVPEVWNSGESTQPGFFGRDPEDFWNDYGLQAESNPALLAQIQERLTAMGSTLTPRNVVDRATATSCAGCHQIASMRDLGGGLVHPDSLRFVHTDETRGLSPALRDSFMPRRQATMQAYLDAHCGSGEPIALPLAGGGAGESPVASEPGAHRVRAIGGGFALGH